MKINYHSNRETTFSKLEEGEAFKINEELEHLDRIVYFTFYDAIQDTMRAINMNSFQAEDFRDDFPVIPIDVEINVYGIEVDKDE